MGRPAFFAPDFVRDDGQAREYQRREHGSEDREFACLFEPPDVPIAIGMAFLC
jgi:hypothetical protein